VPRENVAVASMSADPSFAPSVETAAAPEHATYEPVDTGERGEVAGLAQALRRLGAAVGNLTALQRDHDEMTRRLRDLEETSTRRGAASTALRNQLLERDAHIAFLELEVERLRSVTETRAAVAPAPAPGEKENAPGAAAGHLLFLAAAGRYVVEEGSGPPPPQGETVVVDGARYTVTKHGVSPLPRDDRPCAYLLQIDLPDA
jgi:hypothetical protein